MEQKVKQYKKRGLWREVWQRLLKNRMAVIGMSYIMLVLFLSIFATLFLDYDKAVDVDGANRLLPPSWQHPFGTDSSGRDVLLRIIFGARISLFAGVISTSIALVSGGILGAVAGYYGGKIDNIIMRVLDMFYAIPVILLAIAIVTAFGANIVTLMLALSIGYIPAYARTVRASVIEIRHQEYIEAIIACGATDPRVIFLHIIPNSLAPVIVRATLGIASAVIATASLSYLGLGVQPPTPEWGRILADGQEFIDHPYLTVIPGLVIVSVVLAFNFFGDGLRDALDPKLR